LLYLQTTEITNFTCSFNYR